MSIENIEIVKPEDCRAWSTHGHKRYNTNTNHAPKKVRNNKRCFLCGHQDAGNSWVKYCDINHGRLVNHYLCENCRKKRKL